ncbi:glycoside hydrolase family 15 protein [uncultured Leifsonia sp.]|uniref:glycoside hydrolase family 15 protein n=1 Tax=uncultured Leifsonia sp. TaxID=340359 RepID=UPI0028D24E1F|nr:glycoside hydrolase family 15 protein [uncultured Leifsonia sp.]
MHRYTASRLAERSLALIADLQTPEGAYPASPTFSAYAGYCWFRDGSFIADGVSAAGEVDGPGRFFDWCASVLRQRAEHIRWIVAESRAGRAPEGSRMLPARFTFAGADGADEWWDFQLDGYGTWLWALVEHADRHGVDAARWRDAVELTVDYLTASWQRPCYDWWEEHSEHVHVSTLACVAAGLDAVADAGLIDGDRAAEARTASLAIHGLVAERGVRAGHLVKWLGSTAVDGSLAAALAPLGFVSARSELGDRTIDLLERHLTVDGGTHRYLGDTFYGGGRWPLLSCFLGLAHLEAGDRVRAAELYDFAASTATASLDLPEQVDGHLLAPRMRQEWLDRWGPVATPLLWSHAMLLRLGAALDASAAPAAPTPSRTAVPVQEGLAR